MNDLHDPNLMPEGDADLTPEHAAEKSKTAPLQRWHEVWGYILTNPAAESFERILQTGQASSERALGWVFFSSAGSAAFAGLVFLLISGWWRLLPQLALLALVSGVATTLIFFFSSIFLQFIARAAGGEGEYADFHYAYAASAAPLTIIRMLVLLTTNNPLFFIALNVYQIILLAMALRAVNGFTWGRTAVTLLAAFGALGLLLLPVAVIAIFRFLIG